MDTKKVKGIQKTIKPESILQTICCQVPNIIQEHAKVSKSVPHLAYDEAHPSPQPHGHDHCYQQQRLAPECFGSNASTKVESESTQKSYQNMHANKL